MTKLRIATRESPLALRQAEQVRDGLLAHHPGLEVELVGVKAEGDLLPEESFASLSKEGGKDGSGKGLFVKALETALLEKRVDVAVHSMKDVPQDFPAGLRLGAICARADPRDAFISNRYRRLDDLPEGAVMGTSSLRRQCQIKARRPDLRVENLRGNVNTRLSKLDEGGFDAIILAAAGLLRLGLEERIAEYIPPEVCLPAAGQGALGVEMRVGDERCAALLAPLEDAAASCCVRAERAVSARLQGGCHAPMAAFAEYCGAGELHLRALVGHASGGGILRAEARGPHDAPETLGAKAADDLLAQGAGEILKDARS